MGRFRPSHLAERRCLNLKQERNKPADVLDAVQVFDATVMNRIGKARYHKIY